MQEATWLARWEIRRTWPSYIFTALLAGVLGFFPAVLFSDAAGEGGLDPSVFVSVDVFLLCLCQALMLTPAPQDYSMRVSSPSPTRLQFFRSLPISASNMVRSRVLSRVLAVLLNSVALFGGIYGFSVVVGSSATVWSSPVSYLWFALMWTAYALSFASVHIYGELCLRVGAYNALLFGFLLPLIVIAVALQLVFGVGFTAGALQLASSYGPLSAGIALLVAGTLFILSSRVSARRLARRDLLA